MVGNWTMDLPYWPSVQQQSLHLGHCVSVKKWLKDMWMLCTIPRHFRGGPHSFPRHISTTAGRNWTRALSMPLLIDSHPPAAISTYNFWILPVDGTVTSASHLKTIQLQQTHGYNLKASVRAIMAHKSSGRLCYFHTNTNNCHLLPILACVKGLEDLH